MSDYGILCKTTIFNPAISGDNATINDNSGNYLIPADNVPLQTTAFVGKKDSANERGYLPVMITDYSR
jgi:hypothetical protein